MCSVCGIGYYLPSGVCDHCNMRRSMILRRRSGKQEYKINSIEDLYQLDFIKSHIDEPTFSHLAYQDSSLMAIYRDGFEWWVIGYCKDIKSLGLPEWDRGKYKVIFDGIVEIIDGKDHYCTVGDRVTLKDGRVGVRYVD